MDLLDLIARIFKQSLAIPDDRVGNLSDRRTQRPSLWESVDSQGAFDEMKSLFPKSERLHNEASNSNCEMNNLM